MSASRRRRRRRGQGASGAWWRRCDGCKLRVWETARGKLCKHLPEALNGTDVAVLSYGVDLSVPRCIGRASKPANHSRVWTGEDRARLAELRADRQDTVSIATAMDRTESSVRTQLYKVRCRARSRGEASS